MTKLLKKVFHPDELNGNDKKASLMLELDMISLRNRFNTSSNIEVFDALQNSKEDYPLKYIGSYFFQIINDNTQSQDTEIQALIKYYKEADKINYNLYDFSCMCEGKAYLVGGGTRNYCTGDC